MKPSCVLSLWLLVACSAPEVDPPTGCEENGCPTGYTCDRVLGRCEVIVVVSPDAPLPPDAAEADAPPPDAPLPDALEPLPDAQPPDAPLPDAVAPRDGPAPPDASSPDAPLPPDAAPPDARPPDARAPDARPPDAGLPDAFMGPVTVTVLDDGVPQPGRAVVIHPPGGGAVSARAVTEAGGSVTVLAERNGWITVDDDGDLVTFVGVQPDDELVVGTHADPVVESFGPVSATVTTAFAGADSYYLRTTRAARFGSCDASFKVLIPFTAALDYTSRCVSQGKVDVLAEATAASGPALAYSVARVDGQAGPHAVTMPPWLPPATLSIALDPRPARFNSASASVSSVRAFEDFGAGPLVFPVPPQIDGFRVSISAGYADDAPNANAHAVYNVVVPAGDLIVDMPADLLPIVYDYSLGGSATRPSLQWLTTATGEQAAGIVVELSEGARVWRFILPGDRSSIVAPVVPADLVPFGGDRATVELYTSPAIDSYDEFREEYLRREEKDVFQTSLLSSAGEG